MTLYRHQMCMICFHRKKMQHTFCTALEYALFWFILVLTYFICLFSQINVKAFVVISMQIVRMEYVFALHCAQQFMNQSAQLMVNSTPMSVRCANICVTSECPLKFSRQEDVTGMHYLALVVGTFLFWIMQCFSNMLLCYVPQLWAIIEVYKMFMTLIANCNILFENF